MKECLLYEVRDNKAVRCLTCAHKCLIKPGKKGICHVRENRDGVLYALNYAKVVARNVDPIEKKPLFHFQPGSLSYSIATVGCNFRCLFCQNADISQMPRDQGIIYGREVPAEAVVEDALRHNCLSISYTYTEPTIFLEYAYEVMTLARKEGLKNVFVTNGYMSEEAVGLLSDVLDGANVDLKAFNDKFYREQCGAKLEPVLKAIRLLKEAGVWIEITTLLIPGLNDDPGELKDLAGFIYSVDPAIPWHISRFHPAYKTFNIPHTPLETLHRARKIGIDMGLKYVYTGNVPGDEGENTFCPHCGAKIIARVGFSSRVVNLTDKGTCSRCGYGIEGVWGR
ncbi:AmmeMemoRadiSam system radical SAM enzyme [Thermodesulforhabdus norvegica]|uniref:Pyruvate formate lyase activating enzyme n=1 Tax=Thermodesulforhabdus norvegica TaxID=39841 RepID=A0A1I4UBY8_9BACT|nr:AmmeMemoRadiSam system radical SAM enzyme [Thermodesulforhabdus norvegica]SFM86499.1 pyruvate formate lyase activating enzyme [Thermodesulforhabdus norvegica]